MSMGNYILSMSCANGDEIQAAIHKRSDIFHWLRELDHEGSAWSVVHHNTDDPNGTVTTDITDEIMQQYQS